MEAGSPLWVLSCPGRRLWVVQKTKLSKAMISVPCSLFCFSSCPAWAPTPTSLNDRLWLGRVSRINASLSSPFYCGLYQSNRKQIWRVPMYPYSLNSPKWIFRVACFLLPGVYNLYVREIDGPLSSKWYQKLLVKWSLSRPDTAWKTIALHNME